MDLPTKPSKKKMISVGICIMNHHRSVARLVGLFLKERNQGMYIVYTCFNKLPTPPPEGWGKYLSRRSGGLQIKHLMTPHCLFCIITHCPTPVYTDRQTGGGRGEERELGKEGRKTKGEGKRDIKLFFPWE